MLIGSNFVHYVMKWMTKGNGVNSCGSEERKQQAKHLEALTFVMIDNVAVNHILSFFVFLKTI